MPTAAAAAAAAAVEPWMRGSFVPVHDRHLRRRSGRLLVVRAGHEIVFPN